jgi:hypothetical protein
MSDAYGGDIVTITDPDGNDYELEHLDTIEMDNAFYLAFLPTDLDENDPDYGIVILKCDGAPDMGADLYVPDDEDAERAYDIFMERLFNDDEEAEDGTEEE